MLIDTTQKFYGISCHNIHAIDVRGRAKMILTRDIILEYIKQGKIKIEPFSPDQVGPASIDLTLGNTFRVFDNNESIIHINSEDIDIEKYGHIVEVNDNEPIIIKPKQLVLGITREKIWLPKNIAGWLMGRSRFARIGLMVHITASFVQPNSQNRQVLEIFNASNFNIAIYPGVRVCQLILEETKGEAEFRGKFQFQEKP
ncbi:MAG: dCTP deaminase [Candidatus Asgardarchaeia archaeon]